MSVEALWLPAEDNSYSSFDHQGPYIYHHFRTTPPGRHVVQVCRAEACQAVGGRALEAHVKARLGVDYHQTTPDREITLEAVYCLGNCACGPSVRVNDEVRGRITPEAFDDLMDELQTQPLEMIS